MKEFQSGKISIRSRGKTQDLKEGKKGKGIKGNGSYFFWIPRVAKLFLPSVVLPGIAEGSNQKDTQLIETRRMLGM